MKLKTIINTALVLLTFNRAFAQQPELLIMWDNGNATLLKDLGKVTIEFKSGPGVKNARVYDILKEKGKLVYEKDGCLHDKNIAAIECIKAGKNSRQILVFGLNNEPVIKLNADYDYLIGYAEFKVSYTAFELKKKRENTIVQSNIAKSDTTTFQMEIGTQRSDTIVKASGEIITARIIHINENEVRYKRADLPDGPVYNLTNSANTEVIRY